MSIIPAVLGNPDANPPVLVVAAIQITSSSCHIVYYDNTKFLENIKQGLKKAIS